MTVTLTTPIADLKVPAGLVKALDRGGYKTIRDLTSRPAAFFRDRGYAAKEIAAMVEALAEHGLEFAKPIGDWNVCTVCAACETCGNPRASDAPAVAIGLDGRAKHLGGTVGPVCDGCDEYHRQLVADRAMELTGRLV